MILREERTSPHPSPERRGAGLSPTGRGDTGSDGASASPLWGEAGNNAMAVCGNWYRVRGVGNCIVLAYIVN